jgi:hypothetical protein
MKKCVIAEFPWQVDEIRNMPMSNINIIATNPTMVFYLKKANIKFINAPVLFSHEELWNKYPESNKRAEILCSQIDNILHALDEQVSERNLKLFKYFNYVVKMRSDQIYYFFMLLFSYFDRYGGNEIICQKPEKIRQDDYAQINSEQSLFSVIVGLFASNFDIRVNYYQNTNSEKKKLGKKESAFSFGQPKFINPILSRLKRYKSIPKIKKIKNKFVDKELTLLSLSCKDLDSISDNLEAYGILIKHYKKDFGSLIGIKQNYQFTDSIIKRVLENKKLNKLMAYRNISYLPTLMEQLRILLNEVGRYIKIHDQCYSDFSKIDFDIGFIQSVTPYYPPNIFLMKYCEDNNLPFCCWMHGGYGAYSSIGGYDVTDYQHCANHVIYGQGVKDSVHASSKYIKDKCSEDLNLMVGGTPFFSNIYSKKQKKIVKDKPRILLAIGNFFEYNNFYFGYDRENAEFCNLESHENILETLCKYSGQYDITVKDYPHDNHKEIWKSILRDQEANNIKIITEEDSYSNLAKTSDAIIFTWVSTTFAEALQTKADLLLFDDSSMTEGATKILNETIIFENKLDIFIKKLKSYLDKGSFGHQNKTKAKEYFIDGDFNAGSILKLSKFCYALSSKEPNDTSSQPQTYRE